MANTCSSCRVGYTLVIEGRQIPIKAGEEYFIPWGFVHSGAVIDETRTIHAFGDHRADRDDEPFRRHFNQATGTAFALGNENQIVPGVSPMLHRAGFSPRARLPGLPGPAAGAAETSQCPQPSPNAENSGKVRLNACIDLSTTVSSPALTSRMPLN
jgi:hypothetical protein